jgi:hypothetical protein
LRKLSKEPDSALVVSSESGIAHRINPGSANTRLFAIAGISRRQTPSSSFQKGYAPANALTFLEVRQNMTCAVRISHAGIA